ncbi:hypothetical protein HK101_007816 [Irineochytrium annulatum]|nr:hypothetical protein HK101_007816 [Irineochytrium annulatum]
MSVQPLVASQQPASQLLAAPKPKLAASELKACRAVLTSLQKHQAAWPFNVPVDPVVHQAPNYFDIVKRPMDLSLVARNLADGVYDTIHKFVEDIRQIFDNCFRYNPPTNHIHQLGKKLENYFSNQLSKSLPMLPVYNRRTADGTVAVPTFSVAAALGASVPNKRKSTATSKRTRKASSKLTDTVVASPIVESVPQLPENTRPTRERKPKKFYEPDEIRRTSVDTDGSHKRRRSSQGKKGGLDEDQAEVLRKLQEQFMPRKGKKGSVSQQMMMATMMAAMVGAQSDSDSSSDSESEDEGRRHTVVGDASQALAAASSSSRPMMTRPAAKKRRTSSGSSKPPTQLPAPAAPVQTLTTDQKRSLAEMLGALDARHLTKVAEIIRSGMPNVPMSEEIELDIETIDPATLWALWSHVKASYEEDRRRSEATKVAARKAAKKAARDLRREREGSSGESSDSD